MYLRTIRIVLFILRTRHKGAGTPLRTLDRVRSPPPRTSPRAPYEEAPGDAIGPQQGLLPVLKILDLEI